LKKHDNCKFFASDKFHNRSFVKLSELEIKDFSRVEEDETECKIAANSSFGIFATNTGDAPEKQRRPCKKD